MSESWKNRLWQLVLVCTFAVVLSVCNKAVNSSSDNSSSSGTAIAEESSTVTVSSMPNLTVASTSTVSSMPDLTVSSMPSVTVASQALPTISAWIFCTSASHVSGVVTFSSCDSTDSTSLESNSITVSNLFAAGFAPCPGTGGADRYTSGHIFFCK